MYSLHDTTPPGMMQYAFITCYVITGYTIHTVVALAHAGLIPLEHQDAVQQAFQQSAPFLSSSPDALLALVDKSLPTMIGLGGDCCCLSTRLLMHYLAFGIIFLSPIIGL